MAGIHASVLELIGNTPLVEFNRLEEQLGLKARIVGKLEYFNPAGSHKDRAALSMIEGAERDGLLSGEQPRIADFSSGNTGIAFAAVAAAKGYEFHIGLQPGVSEERTKLLEAYGARFFPVAPEDLAQGLDVVNEHVIDYAREQGAWAALQLDNPDNPAVHYHTTGPEIWDDTDGAVDVFIAGTGTGGAVNGVGTYLKERKPEVRVLALEPHPDSVSDPANGRFVEEYQGIHQFKDVPENFRAGNVNFDVIDEVPLVRYEEGLAALQLLAKTEGVFVGPSSGAVLAVAIREARKPENEGKLIVAFLPDSGERYLSNDIQRPRPELDGVTL